MAVSTTDRGMANAALRKWDGLGVHSLPQRKIPRMMSDERRGGSYVNDASSQAVARTVRDTIVTFVNMQHPSPHRESYSHSGVSENNAHRRPRRPTTMHALTPDFNVENKNDFSSKRK